MEDKSEHGSVQNEQPKDMATNGSVLNGQPKYMAANDRMTNEDAAFASEVADIKTWWSNPRWSTTKRPYTAEQICSKRGNLPIKYASNDMSKKLWNILEHRWQVSSNHNRKSDYEVD